MINIPFIRGLMALSRSDIEGLRAVAEHVPELLSVTTGEILSLVAALEARQPAPKVTHKRNTPQRPSYTKVDPKVLAVAQADPTQSPPPDGWEIRTCSCGAQFGYPVLGEGSRPTKCWMCLHPRARRFRIEVLEQQLRTS